MLLYFFKYLRYILFSCHRKGHGIHSPFVFDLVSRVMRNKTDRDIVLMIENIRKKNLTDRRIIEVNDLGAGSLKMKNKMRMVSDISSCSSVPAKYGRLLAAMAAEYGKPDILELGTSLGISTLYMSSACPQSNVYTIEGCTATAGIASENFKNAGKGNVKLIIGSFDDKLPEIYDEKVKPGLVFVDGNHRKEPVIRYFNQIAEKSDSDTVVIIDDIHLTDEMEEAWSMIRQHEKVTLTIDIFRMGLVFFRKGISRCSYVIKY